MCFLLASTGIHELDEPYFISEDILNILFEPSQKIYIPSNPWAVILERHWDPLSLLWGQVGGGDEGAHTVKTDGKKYPQIGRK